MRAEATFDHGAEALWSHPVLALLSEGYPDLEGRLPTYYSPVRRFTHGVAPTFSRDLHVLGTPPAFVLSQDQTLHLNLEEWRSDSELLRPSISKSQKRSRGCSLVDRESVRYCLVFKDLHPLTGNHPYKPRSERVSISAAQKGRRRFLSLHRIDPHHGVASKSKPSSRTGFVTK